MDVMQLDAAIEASRMADPVSAFVDTSVPAIFTRPWPDGLPTPVIYLDIPYNASALKLLARNTPTRTWRASWTTIQRIERLVLDQFVKLIRRS